MTTIRGRHAATATVTTDADRVTLVRDLLTTLLVETAKEEAHNLYRMGRILDRPSDDGEAVAAALLHVTPKADTVARIINLLAGDPAWLADQEDGSITAGARAALDEFGILGA